MNQNETISLIKLACLGYLSILTKNRFYTIDICLPQEHGQQSPEVAKILRYGQCIASVICIISTPLADTFKYSVHTTNIHFLSLSLFITTTC